MSDDSEKRITEEEERRRIIEEAERKKILESFERVNNRVYSPEETEKIADLNRRIDNLKAETETLRSEHDEKRAYYQSRIKAENIKPVMIPVYFVLAFFAAVDILCILVFRHIFDQTPLLLYAWAFCFFAMGVMAFFQIRFTRKSRSRRAPVQERITELQRLIAENQKRIKELEEERSRV